MMPRKKKDCFILPLNKDYRIAGEEHGWCLQKRTGINKNTGEDVWSGVSWDTDQERFLNNAYNRILRTTPCHGLEECIKEARKLSHELKKALNPFIKGCLDDSK